MAIPLLFGLRTCRRRRAGRRGRHGFYLIVRLDHGNNVNYVTRDVNVTNDFHKSFLTLPYARLRSKTQLVVRIRMLICMKRSSDAVDSVV